MKPLDNSAEVVYDTIRRAAIGQTLLGQMAE